MASVAVVDAAYKSLHDSNWIPIDAAEVPG
jgi:hypothetical protein